MKNCKIIFKYRYDFESYLVIDKGVLKIQLQQILRLFYEAGRGDLGCGVDLCGLKSQQRPAGALRHHMLNFAHENGLGLI